MVSDAVNVCICIYVQCGQYNVPRGTFITKCAAEPTGSTKFLDGHPQSSLSAYNSPNRDGDLNIDITLDRIRVGTNGVGALDKLSRRLLVDAGDGHGERGGQHEPTRVVAPEAQTAWLAPETSTLWLLARVAYHRSRSGLMALSLPATNIPRPGERICMVITTAGIRYANVTRT